MAPAEAVMPVMLFAPKRWKEEQSPKNKVDQSDKGRRAGAVVYSSRGAVVVWVAGGGIVCMVICF